MFGLSAPVLHQWVMIGFIALLLLSAVKDAREFRIPNQFSLALALLYPAYVLTTPETVAWWYGLAIGAGLLVAGFILWHLRFAGGGDAKFLAVTGMWAGAEYWLEFLVVTGIAGGITVAALWLHHRWAQAPTLSTVFAFSADSNFLKQPMPYGVAIAAGGLYVAFTVLRLL